MERLLKFNSWFHSLYGQKRILPWFSLELLHGIFLLLFLRTQPDWNYMLWILVTFSSPAWRNLLNFWLQFVMIIIIVALDYIFSCFLLVIHSNCFGSTTVLTLMSTYIPTLQCMYGSSLFNRYALRRALVYLYILCSSYPWNWVGVYYVVCNF